MDWKKIFLLVKQIWISLRKILKIISRLLYIYYTRYNIGREKN